MDMQTTTSKIISDRTLRNPWFSDCCTKLTRSLCCGNNINQLKIITRIVRFDAREREREREKSARRTLPDNWIVEFDQSWYTISLGRSSGLNTPISLSFTSHTSSSEEDNEIETRRVTKKKDGNFIFFFEVWTQRFWPGVTSGFILLPVTGLKACQRKILKISQKLLLLDFNSPILLHSHTRYLSNDIPKLSKPLFYPFFLL